jgi:hypothetical protein
LRAALLGQVGHPRNRGRDLAGSADDTDRVLSVVDAAERQGEFELIGDRQIDRAGAVCQLAIADLDPELTNMPRAAPPI